MGFLDFFKSKKDRSRSEVLDAEPYPQRDDAKQVDQNHGAATIIGEGYQPGIKDDLANEELLAAADVESDGAKQSLIERERHEAEGRE